MSDKVTYNFNYDQQPIRIDSHSSEEPYIFKESSRMPPREQLKCVPRPEIASNPSSPGYSFSYSGPCPVHPKKKIRFVYNQEVLERRLALQASQENKIQADSTEELIARSSAFTSYHRLPERSATFENPGYGAFQNHHFSGVNQFYTELQKTEVHSRSFKDSTILSRRRSPPNLIPISNVPPTLTPPMELPMTPTGTPFYPPQDPPINPQRESDEKDKSLRDVIARIVWNKSTPDVPYEDVKEIFGQVEDNRRDDEVSDSRFAHSRSKDYFCDVPKGSGSPPARRSSCSKPPSGKDKHVTWLNSVPTGSSSKPSSYKKSVDWLYSRSPSRDSKEEQSGSHPFDQQTNSFLEKSIIEWNKAEVSQFWMDACSRMDLPPCQFLPSVTGPELTQMTKNDFKSVYREHGEQFYYHFTAFQSQKSTKMEESYTGPSYSATSSPQQERQSHFSSPHLPNPHARFNSSAIEGSNHSQPMAPSPHAQVQHTHYPNLQFDPRHLPSSHHSPMQQHNQHHHSPHHNPNHGHHQQKQPSQHHSYHPKVAQPRRSSQGYHGHYHSQTFPMSPSDEYVPQGPAYAGRFDDNHGRASMGLHGATNSFPDSMPSVSALGMPHDADSDLASSDSEDSWTEEKVQAPEKPLKRGPGRPRKPESERAKKTKKSIKVWQFFHNLLQDPKTCPELIRWEDAERGTFRIVQSDVIARMWGMRKNNSSSNTTKMNYEKLSRAMRYHYKSGNLEAVIGKRLVYKFGINAKGWRPKDPLNPNFTRNY